jgi:carbohydrate diacid regulator
MKEKLYDMARRLKKVILKKVNVELKIGIGNAYDHVQDLNKSYQEASKTLSMLEKFPQSENIKHFDDAALEIILTEIPESAKKTFLRETISPLLPHADLIETLRVLYQCDLHLNDASRQLNIHRNTLIYRLEKIKSLTGSDPRVFHTALKLQLAMDLHKI